MLFRFTAALLTLLLVGQPGRAQRRQLNALVQQYVRAGQFNGTVLVARPGKILLSRGYGLANREWQQPNAADTKFRIGSLTKQFTAVLVLQLVEKGQLRLDAPIRTYLPDYPRPSGDKITLHHLLTHTAGLPNYTAHPAASAALLPTTPAQTVQSFANQPLEFEPGSRYAYSNSGYVLLGYIIEQVTGKPYAQVLTDHILRPLRLLDTGYDLPGPILPKRAAGYEPTAAGPLVNAPYLDMTGPYAAGALYSTAPDLYRWSQALDTNELLSAASRQVLFTPFKNGYAYGWNIARMPLGADTLTVQRHAGVINGFRAFLLRAPRQGYCVVVLDNESHDSTPKLSAMLLRVLYHQPTEGPDPEPAAPARSGGGR